MKALYFSCLITASLPLPPQWDWVLFQIYLWWSIKSPCFTFLLLFCKHFIWGDLARGEAVKHHSPEQQDIARGTEAVRGRPWLGWCWPAAACRADAVVASVVLKLCRVFLYTGLHVAMLPCHVLDLSALSSWYGPCPSRTPCQCPHLGRTASLYTSIQLHQGRALVMGLEGKTRPG